MMRAHKPISKNLLATNMRPINVTLDSQTWEYAKEKSNFSEWVRGQLRSEKIGKDGKTKVCIHCHKRYPVEHFYYHKCIPEGEEE